MQKVAFYTLGCKLNFSETSYIAKQFVESGYSKVNFEDGADAYVINTCSVTDHADKKCRKVVEQALKFNPNAFIAIIGCYAQLKPEEIASIPGVDIVLGANEKFNIKEHLSRLGKKQDKAQISNSNIKEVTKFIPSYSTNDRTRTFLKVQDGCDYFCTFCTIPLARGKSRNAGINETFALAKQAISEGSKEIVLTGVNIGDFGQDGEENFFRLIQRLDEVKENVRFRISSIEPNLLTEEIIDWVADSACFVPHFHIPLQSGSDEILRLMRRKYDTKLYAERIAHIRKKIPHCCIGVDVITGFPGETEEEFLKTYKFLNELDINYLHVFTYSERKNTGAIKLKGKVHYAERKKRTEMLRILSEKKLRAFYHNNIGKTSKVLFEAENDGRFMHGFTENYIKVKMPYDPQYVNEIKEVKLTGFDETGLMNIVLTHSENIPKKFQMIQVEQN
jgi:threonylcarbamoyladenosine tRNA methylthiotransferase MtaB